MRPSPIRRVIVLVLDGLRPDAVPRFGLHHIAALARRGASTMLGRTVTPSITSSAMASLLTGAAPERHGLLDGRFRIPRPTGVLHPLPRLLAQHAFPSSAFLARVPMLLSGVAHRIATHVGVSQARFSGSGANDILTAATTALRDQSRGLILLHWPDGDRAGHAHGWMSEAYADHGGGGTVPDHHHSEHPLDVTIPIIMAGGAVRRGDLGRGSSLLDVPATVAWALGIPVPTSFAGRPLRESLLVAPEMVAA